MPYQPSEYAGTDILGHAALPHPAVFASPGAQSLTSPGYFGGYITFLGFHPYKEVVFLSEGLSRGLAYHLNTSKVQELGNLSPNTLWNVYGYPTIHRRVFFHTHLGSESFQRKITLTRHGVPFQSPQRQALDLQLQNYCLFGMRILKAGIYLQNDGYQLGSSVSYSYTTLTQAAETHYISTIMEYSKQCLVHPMSRPPLRESNYYVPKKLYPENRLH